MRPTGFQVSGIAWDNPGMSGGDKLDELAVPPLPPPPPPLPPPPGYPIYPPPGYPTGPVQHRRRWPVVAAAAAVGAVVAAVIATIVTTAVTANTIPAAGTAAPKTVTMTATPTAPLPPAPLPAAQADRQTCQNGWLAAEEPVKAAGTAQSVIPKGMDILDPAVRANPDWSAALQKAGDFYTQAADILGARIAPGTTPILAQAADSATKAFYALGATYKNFDPVNGNAHDIALQASDEMAVLCQRLAP
jgi:hypothetical protein